MLRNGTPSADGFNSLLGTGEGRVCNFLSVSMNPLDDSGNTRLHEHAYVRLHRGSVYSNVHRRENKVRFNNAAGLGAMPQLQERVQKAR